MTSFGDACCVVWYKLEVLETTESANKSFVWTLLLFVELVKFTVLKRGVVLWSRILGEFRFWRES